MPNGKPGDHPLTDVLVHDADVFTPEIDHLVREEAKARGWDTSAAIPGAMAVETLLQNVAAQGRVAGTVELWVSDRLVLGNQPIQHDLAMAILTDKALELGLEPAGFEQGDRGRTYRYRK